MPLLRFSLCPTFFRHLGVSLNPKYLLEWKNGNEGCSMSCWMLQSNSSSLQRYASDHTCTPFNLRLWYWVCLSFQCYCLQRSKDGLISLVAVHGLRHIVCAQFTPCTASTCIYFHPVRDLNISFCLSCHSVKWLSELERSLTLAHVSYLSDI